MLEDFGEPFYIAVLTVNILVELLYKKTYKERF